MADSTGPKKGHPTAGEKSQGPDLRTHPLVDRLRGEADPAADRVLLVGYISLSPQDGTIRLYTGLDFQTYYAIPRGMILATEPVDREDEESPTSVYVDVAARVELVQVSTQTIEASYLRGAIATGYLARAQASVAAQVLGPVAYTGDTCPAADRQRIARSRRSVLRHRIIALNVRGNRQQAHCQVSVSRSTTCRASASTLAR